MFGTIPNFEKMLKKLLKNAIASLEEQAKYYERKARTQRQTVKLVKQFAPAVLEMLKPPQFPKMTKTQKAAMRKQMKDLAKMYPGGCPVATVAPRLDEKPN